MNKLYENELKKYETPFIGKLIVLEETDDMCWFTYSEFLKVNYPDDVIPYYFIDYSMDFNENMKNIGEWLEIMKKDYDKAIVHEEKIKEKEDAIVEFEKFLDDNDINYSFTHASTGSRYYILEGKYLVRLSDHPTLDKQVDIDIELPNSNKNYGYQLEDAKKLIVRLIQEDIEYEEY